MGEEAFRNLWIASLRLFSLFLEVYKAVAHPQGGWPHPLQCMSRLNILIQNFDIHFMPSKKSTLGAWAETNWDSESCLRKSKDSEMQRIDQKCICKMLAIQLKFSKPLIFWKTIATPSCACQLTLSLASYSCNYAWAFVNWGSHVDPVYKSYRIIF